MDPVFWLKFDYGNGEKAPVLVPRIEVSNQRVIDSQFFPAGSFATTVKSKHGIVLPASPNANPPKQTYLLEIQVDWKFQGASPGAASNKIYNLLSIRQAIEVENGQITLPYWFRTESSQPAKMTMKDFQTKQMCFGAHPLLSAGNQVQNARTLIANLRVLDVTDFWKDHYGDDRSYKILFGINLTPSEQEVVDLIKRRDVDTRVYANNSGTPYIWFGFIPERLKSARDAKALIFHRPAGTSSPAYSFNQISKVGSMPGGLDTSEHRGWNAAGLLCYVVAPIDEGKFREKLNAKGASQSAILDNAIQFFGGKNAGLERLNRNRGVYACFPSKGDELRLKGQPQSEFMRFGLNPAENAGLEKAVACLSGQENLILLLPLRQSCNSCTKNSKRLDEVQSSIIATMWARSIISTDSSVRLDIASRYILSSHSRGGELLWPALESDNAADEGERHIDCIIMSEPQFQNDSDRLSHPPSYDSQISKFINRGGKVCLIGRHHQPHYRPGKKFAAAIVSAKNGLALPREKVEYDALYGASPTSAWLHLAIMRYLKTNADVLLSKSDKKHAVFSTFDAVFKHIQHEDPNHFHRFSVTGGAEISIAPPVPVQGFVFPNNLNYKTFYQTALEWALV